MRRMWVMPPAADAARRAPGLRPRAGAWAAGRHRRPPAPSASSRRRQGPRCTARGKRRGGPLRSGSRRGPRRSAFGVRHMHSPPATYSCFGLPGPHWARPGLLDADWRRQVLVTAPSRRAPGPFASKVGGAAARASQGRLGK